MSDSKTLRELLLDVLNGRRVHIDQSLGIDPMQRQYGHAVLDDVERDLMSAIDDWEREARGRVLCALGTPTKEDRETIRRVLEERKEGRCGGERCADEARGAAVR